MGDVWTTSFSFPLFFLSCSGTWELPTHLRRRKMVLILRSRAPLLELEKKLLVTQKLDLELELELELQLELELVALLW